MLLDTYYVSSTNGGRGESRSVVLAAVTGAALFEVVTVVATQLRSVRPRSPWQDDPYNVMVSFAVFVVPVLAAMLLLRLFVAAAIAFLAVLLVPVPRQATA